MNKHKGDILIIGAGPAGMAAAMELYKAEEHFILIEKASQVGGLAKTYQFGEFRTDNGPHRFFSKNQYLYDFIEDLLEKRWIKVNRFTRFYIDGKFYKYPIEIGGVLRTMGIFKTTRSLFDYLLAKIKFLGRQPKNFEEYVISKFGQTIAELNLLNYTEKIWGLPCSEISIDWATQRIEGLSITSLLKKMFVKKGGPKTLVDQFYYPETGTGLIYETIKKRIERENSIFLGIEPTKICHDDKSIKEVQLSNGAVYHPRYLISSIPITIFVNLLDPKPPAEVQKVAKNLRFRSQVYLFLTINKPRVTHDQWIYFPDKEIPFGRISEMKNFSSKMSPPDKTSLFIEFFCWKGDEIWNKSKEELFEFTVPWLEKLNFISREEVIEVFHLKQQYTYPVYELGYQKNVDVLKKYLDGFSNLIYIGRPGRFKYTNQDHSLEMGILAARSVIYDRKLDVEDIGAEQEYFEKGYVK